VRLPLDLLLVASANPEDYTNRGRIITPLKDRFGAEVRTHYPIELADEVRLLHQEAHTSWLDGRVAGDQHGGGQLETPMVPEHLVEIVARFTRLVRDSNHVDQRSGVSARFAIAGLETVAASAVRRAAVAGETRPVARVVDLPSIVPASRGKVEFADSGSDPDDEREMEVLEHLLRQATAQTFRARCAGLDLTGLQEHFTGGETVESGELVPAAALLGQLGTIPKLAELLGRLGVPEGEQSAEQAAAAVEFALEGLYLTRRLAKDTDGARTVYGA
jgi:magnesium chelatase subunit I